MFREAPGRLHRPAEGEAFLPAAAAAARELERNRERQNGIHRFSRRRRNSHLFPEESESTSRRGGSSVFPPAIA